MLKATSPDRRSVLAAGLGAFALLASGCGRREALVELPSVGATTFTGLSMGSSYTVKIAGGALTPVALAAAQQAVAAALDDTVQRMSHYDAGSEVSRLSRQPLGRAMQVSEPTLRVLQAAAAVHLASEGAFDVGIGRAVVGWGFGPDSRPGRVLPADELATLRRGHVAGALQVDARSGTVTRQADVWADLSGIAKGWGVDRAALALQALGLGDYMVEVGGEIRSSGRNALGQPWQLAIEQPDAMPQRALRIVPLSGRALATSGDYRNFFVHQGRRYSHEIDPRSAEPVAHALASVSVVADDCTAADAWSTALFVMGPERGLAAARRLDLAAHFVTRDGQGRYLETLTPAFAALGSSTASA